MDEIPVELLFADYPPAIRDTGLALRSLIFRAVPDATERVRPGWRWIGYSLPDGRRIRNFAWIGPERKHIHLGFEHGTLMADPDRILQGVQERLRKFRYVTFEPAIDMDDDVLIALLEEAARLAVLPSAARRAMADDAAIPVDVGEGGPDAR